MMKRRRKYERPELVDLSAECASGAQCNTGDEVVGCVSGSSIDYTCNDGSCVGRLTCNGGTAANECINGTRACSWGSCVGCCQSGSSNSSGTTCFCNPGSWAGWTCGYGGNACCGCNTTGAADYGYC